MLWPDEVLCCIISVVSLVTRFLPCQGLNTNPNDLPSLHDEGVLHVVEKGVHRCFLVTNFCAALVSLRWLYTFLPRTVLQPAAGLELR